MSRRRRQLAASILQQLGQKDCVLVTSAEHGAGRTTLLSDLRPHFEHLAAGKVCIALLMVNARKTLREDLETSAQWLREAGLPPLGIVWNEKGLPPVGARLYQRTQRANRWIPHWLLDRLKGVSL